MVTGVIYKYTSPSGKVYIGQTTNELYRRFIRDYPSIADAAAAIGGVGTNISACCNGKINTYRGYKWRYK